MMAEEAAGPAPENDAAAADEVETAAAVDEHESTAANDQEEAAADDQEATAANDQEEAAAAAPEENVEPVFDPDACKAIAVCLDEFWEGVHSGEWEETDFRYYLEPAGVLNGPLVCARSPEGEPHRAGLLMTRAGWQAKKLFLDDGVNPETYELSFPKEFGYVKPLSHYVPETYEHAKYPWSKKY